MSPFELATGLTLTAQTIGAAVMALLMAGFYRQYRKSYLGHWTLGWAALTVVQVASAVAFAPSLRFGAALLGSIAGFLHIGWFLFGIYELIHRRPVRIMASRRILQALVTAGVLLTIPVLITAPFHRAAATPVAARSIAAALGFTIAAVALWRTRGSRKGVGFSVFSLSLAALAIDQAYLFYSALRAPSLSSAESFAYLAYVHFLIDWVVGLAMIACLLEDEREAAELAAGEIEHLAYHDALTGLPNRPLFIDRLIIALAQANRSQHMLAVFFLDLDRFKDINDSLGHSAGDALLKAVAERIRRCVREGDTVARFGGDEFTLLIPRIDTIEDAAKIASKITETLKIPFQINARELFVTASAGVSIYPSDGVDPETLVRNADTAMYRAKEQGRDNYQLYTPAMNAQALEKLALENMLRKAVGQNELVLHYQPIVDARTRAVVGAEALVRWQHPQLGLLSPAHFISVAERSGLIIPIGEWILRTAAQQIRAWQTIAERELRVAVNLSARQFQQSIIIEQVRAVIQEMAIDPSLLELEITESSAMQNAENAIHTLRELKNLGVRIAMDDFGTGYSSLNYLKRFPIDTLKLDRMFIRDITTDASDAAIVNAVILLAHDLKLKVVGEGVEREDQLHFLQRQKCDLLQGYLFSKPLPAHQFESFLTRQQKAAAI